MGCAESGRAEPQEAPGLRPPSTVFTFSPFPGMRLPLRDLLSRLNNLCGDVCRPTVCCWIRGGLAEHPCPPSFPPSPSQGPPWGSPLLVTAGLWGTPTGLLCPKGAGARVRGEPCPASPWGSCSHWGPATCPRGRRRHSAASGSHSPVQLTAPPPHTPRPNQASLSPVSVSLAWGRTFRKSRNPNKVTHHPTSAPNGRREIFRCVFLPACGP